MAVHALQKGMDILKSGGDTLDAGGGRRLRVVEGRSER